MSAVPPEPAPSGWAAPGGPSIPPVPGQAAQPVSVPAPLPVPRQAEQTLHWRTAVLLMSSFLTVLLGSVLMLMPVPFVVFRPGPAINTLGKDDGHPLITVTGHASYPAKGTLDLTTVTVSGGPGSRLMLLDALRAWFDDTLTVAPVDDVYPPGQSVDASRQQDQHDMVTSQESATVAALRELGIAVPATLTIDSLGLPDGSTPDTPLRPKDVIVAIGDTPVPDLDTLTARMRQVTPGSTIPITVKRDGVERVVQTPTHAYQRRAILGVRIDPTFHPPFQVTIRIDNIGGPSAGTMFALGIIDLLTPGDLTGGANVAGTGTIDVNGDVGAIGGIVQKMNGARRVGARWFLAPADNCADVRGNVPGGLRVVRIATLREAHRAVEQIGAGHGDSLPTCG